MLKEDKPFKHKAPPNNPPRRHDMSSRLVTGLRVMCFLAVVQCLALACAAVVDATSSVQFGPSPSAVPSVRIEDVVSLSVLGPVGLSLPGLVNSAALDTDLSSPDLIDTATTDFCSVLVATATVDSSTSVIEFTTTVADVSAAPTTVFPGSASETSVKVHSTSASDVKVDGYDPGDGSASTGSVPVTAVSPTVFISTSDPLFTATAANLSAVPTMDPVMSAFKAAQTGDDYGSAVLLGSTVSASVSSSTPSDPASTSAVSGSLASAVAPRDTSVSSLAVKTSSSPLRPAAAAVVSHPSIDASSVTTVVKVNPSGPSSMSASVGVVMPVPSQAPYANMTRAAADIVAPPAAEVGHRIVSFDRGQVHGNGMTDVIGMAIGPVAGYSVDFGIKVKLDAPASAPAASAYDTSDLLERSADRGAFLPLRPNDEQWKMLYDSLMLRQILATRQSEKSALGREEEMTRAREFAREWEDAARRLEESAQASQDAARRSLAAAMEQEELARRQRLIMENAQRQAEQDRQTRLNDERLRAEHQAELQEELRAEIVKAKVSRLYNTLQAQRYDEAIWRLTVSEEKARKVIAEVREAVEEQTRTANEKAVARELEADAGLQQADASKLQADASMAKAKAADEEYRVLVEKSNTRDDQRDTVPELPKKQPEIVNPNSGDSWLVWVLAFILFVGIVDISYRRWRESREFDDYLARRRPSSAQRRRPSNHTGWLYAMWQAVKRWWSRIWAGEKKSGAHDDAPWDDAEPDNVRRMDVVVPPYIAEELQRKAQKNNRGKNKKTGKR